MNKWIGISIFKLAQTLHLLKIFTDLYSKIDFFVGDVYGAISKNIRSGKGFREYLTYLCKFLYKEGKAQRRIKKQFIDPAKPKYISYF